MRDIEDPGSDDTTNAFGFVSLILGIASATLGLVHIVDRPFTESELANFVDNWGPAVMGGLVLLTLFLLGALGCALVAWCCKSLPRKLFGASAVAFVAAFLLEVAALNILTSETEKASGQPLSWWPLG
jgi:hypothetical protein